MPLRTLTCRTLSGLRANSARTARRTNRSQQSKRGSLDVLRSSESASSSSSQREAWLTPFARTTPPFPTPARLIRPPNSSGSRDPDSPGAVNPRLRIQTILQGDPAVSFTAISASGARGHCACDSSAHLMMPLLGMSAKGCELITAWSPRTLPIGWSPSGSVARGSLREIRLLWVRITAQCFLLLLID